MQKISRKYVKICMKICRKYAENMQKICRNIYKKYDKYAKKYDKYAMWIYYGKYARKYAKYAKYADHAENMQNMHSPPCWWSRTPGHDDVTPQLCDGPTRNRHGPLAAPRRPGWWPASGPGLVTAIDWDSESHRDSNCGLGDPHGLWAWELSRTAVIGFVTVVIGAVTAVTAVTGPRPRHYRARRDWP